VQADFIVLTINIDVLYILNGHIIFWLLAFIQCAAENQTGIGDLLFIVHTDITQHQEQSFCQHIKAFAGLPVILKGNASVG